MRRASFCILEQQGHRRRLTRPLDSGGFPLASDTVLRGVLLPALTPSTSNAWSADAADEVPAPPLIAGPPLRAAVGLTDATMDEAKSGSVMAWATQWARYSTLRSCTRCIMSDGSLARVRMAARRVGESTCGVSAPSAVNVRAASPLVEEGVTTAPAGVGAESKTDCAAERSGAVVCRACCCWACCRWACCCCSCCCCSLCCCWA